MVQIEGDAEKSDGCEKQDETDSTAILTETSVANRIGPNVDAMDDIETKDLSDMLSEYGTKEKGNQSLDLSQKGLDIKSDLEDTKEELDIKTSQFTCIQPCLSADSSEMDELGVVVTQRTDVNYMTVNSKDSLKSLNNGYLCQKGQEKPEQNTGTKTVDYLCQKGQEKPEREQNTGTKTVDSIQNGVDCHTQLQVKDKGYLQNDITQEKLHYEGKDEGYVQNDHCVVDCNQDKWQTKQVDKSDVDITKDDDSITMLTFPPSESMCRHHLSDFIEGPMPILDLSSVPGHADSPEDGTTSCVQRERKVSTLTFDVPSPTFDVPTPITGLYDESTFRDNGYRRQRFIKFNLLSDNDTQFTKQTTPISSKLQDEIKVNPTTKLKCDSSVINNNSRNIDRGWAWMVLLGGALNHVLADGIISSLGVFIMAWQEQLSGSLASISWPLTLTLGGAYIAGPLASALCKSFSLRQVTMFGTILSTLAFIAASYSTTLWLLYITFSAAGLGFAFTIQPTSVVIAYYFDNLFARANGVSFAGVGVGVFILPPFFQFLIDEYGWQNALFIIAALAANMGICAALYRPTPLEIENRHKSVTNSRQNPSKDNSAYCRKCNGCSQFLANITASFDFTLFKDFKFCFLMAAKFLYGLSYVIVIFYTPARAVHAGMTNINAAMLVSVIGISSFVSRLLHGYIIDYKIMTATNLTSIAFFVCSLCCLINPLIDSYEGLIVLNMIVGLSSGIFNSTIPIVAKEYVGLQKVSGGVGLIHLMMGFGVTLGSYKASILVDLTDSYDIPFFIAGAGFMICSIFICVKPVSEYFMTKRLDHNGFLPPQPKRDLVGQDNVALELDHVDSNGVKLGSLKTVSEYLSTETNVDDCVFAPSQLTNDGLCDTMADSGRNHVNGVYLGNFTKEIEC